MNDSPLRNIEINRTLTGVPYPGPCVPGRTVESPTAPDATPSVPVAEV